MSVFELIALTVLAFYFSILITVLVLIKKLIYFLYIWQWKEYRLDKFLDLVSSPKFPRVFLDWFTTFRILALFALILDYVFSRLYSPFVYLFIILTSLIEIAIFTRQIIQKRALLPKFSFKILGLSVTAIVANLVLYSFLDKIFSCPNCSFLISTIPISLLMLSLIQPLIIGFSILLLWPLDTFLKYRITLKAKHHRLTLLNLKVVGISGSYGKSSTKEILASLLATKFNVEKTFKNHNSTLAVARKILSLDSKTDIFISEIGAYKQGDGIDQCKFSFPNTSIITGLNNQHYSLFGGKEQIISAESESLQFLKPENLAIINWDSPWCQEIVVPKDVKLIKYGFSEDADIRAEIISSDLEGTEFNVFWEGQMYNFRTNLIGKGSIQNILASMACCTAYGFKLENLSKSLLNLPSSEGTLNVEVTEYGYKINDSYNANLDGVLNAIELLKNFDGKKIIFLDDIAELGIQSVNTHQLVAKSLGEANIDFIVLVGPNYSKMVQNELLKLGLEKEKIIVSALPNKEIKRKLELFKNLKGKKNLVILYQGYGSRKFIQEKDL